ncbi:IS481 family transposase [Bordetella pertussis]|nr:transposase, IS481 family [Bordetella pertussis STO1-SEAT-0007]QKC31423.1 IS481 family transposase [Bordetella pertussis]QKC42365.1 IS481 family transposase [Bordetella pertussis]QKC57351.1 IS481 family transposase [Bordetella pertussis]SNV55127.1 transposase [Bordetella pertussis]
MNTHKHARLTFLRRLEMVQQLIAHQVCVPEAARAYGVTAPTVRKWLGRFLAQGQAGLADASSRPTVSPRAIAPAKALAIVELRRKRLTQARIAQALGVSASTVSRVLARAGLSHLADLEPAEPVVRYEHQAPGDLLHIDIKKLGRIQRPGHRVTGNRRDTVEGAGWDFVFVAIDDHARVAFTDIHPDERFPSAVQFLKDAVAYYQRLGVTIQRLLTDNGSAFRSRAFAALCHELGIKHRFTRPYRPQTNGKAERFIQSALREWAYAHTYQNSQHRADAMKSWLHHYNWHRPHQGIGRAVPISRLNLDEYNLLTVHRLAGHWRVRGGLGVQSASIVRDNNGQAGKRVRNVARLNGSLFLSYRPPQGWYGETGVTFVGARYADNANAVRLPDYGRLDAMLGYRTGAWDWRLAVRNLADKTYFASATSAGQIRYGEPRVALATLQYVF